jgi:hypothetical protein
MLVAGGGVHAGDERNTVGDLIRMTRIHNGKEGSGTGRDWLRVAWVLALGKVVYLGALAGVLWLCGDSAIGEPIPSRT